MMFGIALLIICVVSFLAFFVFTKKNAYSNYELYREVELMGVDHHTANEYYETKDFDSLISNLMLGNYNSENLVAKIEKSNKVIVMICGENGTGKTNLVFQLARYFEKSHSIIVSTIDNFKGNYQEFVNMAESSNVKYFNPGSFTGRQSLKNMFRIYLEDFLNTNKTMMIVDTSGRGDSNVSLQKEINALISYGRNLCENNQITPLFLYNVSGFNKIKLDTCYKQYDGISLSQVSTKVFKYKKIDALYKVKPILFVSYGKKICDCNIFTKKFIGEVVKTNLLEIESLQKTKK